MTFTHLLSFGAKLVGLIFLPCLQKDIWKHEKEESGYPIGYLINNHMLKTILKEINPEYSLEGLMLPLKLQ